MPWRGPEYPGDFPTLGYQVAELIQERCVIPDGDLMGQPFMLTKEMLSWLVWFYRIEPEGEGGKLRYRRGQLVRPQKWGKGPFSAAVICAEVDEDGPVRFDGWDADGEPVGKPWPTPHVQVTAVSQEQTDNVWRALKPMIELGPMHADIPDTGFTRINLPKGGLIEPVTSATLSRIGQRITFAVQDQTESWYVRNGMRRLADAQQRGLAGMGGRAMETPNGWDPNEDSVAQQTHRVARKVPDIYSDFPTPPAGSFRNQRERRRVLKFSYGDSWWVDLDRIDADCVEMIERGEIAQAERWFGNRIVTGSGVAFDVDRWERLKADVDVKAKELIVVGFDGARVDDATAMIATDVLTGHQWPLGIWERPENAPDDWEVDETAVTEALAAAMDRYEVWRVYADPPYWQDTINGWAGKWGDKVVIHWWTNRVKAMCWAVRHYVEAQAGGFLTHDGDPTFARHIANARRRPHPQIRDDKDRPMWDITKDRPGSPDKIDGAMAAVLSWEARGDAIAAGAKKRRGGGAKFF